MILRLMRCLSALAATQMCISGWTWMSGISCVSTASSAFFLEVIVPPFTREQIQRMLAQAEADAATTWKAIMSKMDYFAQLQRDIGAMKMELEIMDERTRAEDPQRSSAQD